MQILDKYGIMYLNMSTERGLNPAELRSVLASTKFAQRIADLAIYTRTLKAEGGLCVYKNLETGKLSVSPAHLPTEDEREERRQEYNQVHGIDDHLSADESRYTFDHARLLMRGFRYRRDVGLFVHSHPAGSNGLTPSTADLVIYEEQNGSSPNVINGILTASHKRARIFLYGQTASHHALGAYQAYEGFESAIRVQQMLADDGFCTALVEYSVTPSSIGIVSNPDKVVADYFKLP